MLDPGPIERGGAFEVEKVASMYKRGNFGKEVSWQNSVVSDYLQCFYNFNLYLLLAFRPRRWLCGRL